VIVDGAAWQEGEAMSSDIGDAFKREILGSSDAGSAVSDLPEDFNRETLGVVHPGHQAVMELDPEYFKALKNYYSTWTISRPDAAIPRTVTEFIITGVLLTQGKMHGARVHIRRALLAGATPRETFQAIAAAAIPGGVPVVWHGAAMVKAEMEELGLRIDERYGGAENPAP
jgi:alkylhydroperoxidase/carboxymuconolactone decarboxylase family protein YurZ